MPARVLEIAYRSHVYLVSRPKAKIIHDWEHLVAVFKVLLRGSKFSLDELGQTRQLPGEDLDLYVKRFYRKALVCCVAVDEETFLHDMANEYRVFLETLSFPSSLN